MPFDYTINDKFLKLVVISTGTQWNGEIFELCYLKPNLKILLRRAFGFSTTVEMTILLIDLTLLNSPIVYIDLCNKIPVI